MHQILEARSLRRTFLRTAAAVTLGAVGLAVLAPALARGREGQSAQAGKVTLWHLPNGAIQPQAAVNSAGKVHLIYFQGNATGGDLFYLERTENGEGAPRLSTPIRVNSEAGSAGAVGTVRTAHLALGKDDRVHVVWNGLGPKGTNGFPTAYEAYTRLNETGTAFEPQRNLISWATGLDGGGSIAADKDGDIYVVWHALASAKDEAGRAVYMARSRDNGKTFAREKQVNPIPTGACGCCGLRAFVDSNGVLSILYRAAGEKVNRDTMLVVSRDKGETFQEKLLQRWNLNACPMSTYALNQGKALSDGKNALLAAWETQGRVYYSAIDPGDLSFSRPVAAEGASQKHPTIVANAQRETLLAWTEGTGWQRGGALVWQVYDRDGKPTAEKGRVDGVPVWGLPTAYVRRDGSFVLVY